MRLCCVQLFNVAGLNDVLPIWRAESSSFDAFCSIDVQLLCGGELAETKAYLAAEGTEEATDALDYLRRCEAAGDFSDFSVARLAASFADYCNV